MNEIGSQAIELRDASELHPNPWNPNAVGVENMDKLKASIQNNGFFKPVLVRTLEDGKLEIIGGEHRILAAGELGVKVPVLNLGELSDALAKKYTLMDNDSYGENDATRLAAVLKDLEAEGVDILSEMTYSEQELSDMLNMTVDTDMELLSELDDLDLDTLPKDTDTPESDAGEGTVFKTLKIKIPIDRAEDFTDTLEAIAAADEVDDSDPAVVRGEVFMNFIDNWADPR